MTEAGPDERRTGDADVGRTLGGALRAARGAESLRELSRRVSISFQSLSKYERDDQVPPRRFLEILDIALGQGGALLAHVAYDHWEPIEEPTTQHRWTVPGEWRGPVWAVVVSTGEPLGEVFLRWGPWANRVTGIATARQALSLQVNRDARATDDRVLTCVTAVPAHVFFATGQPGPALDARDCTGGWYPYEDGDLLRTAGRLLSDALAHTGRTTEEVAEFLGVDVAVVEALAEGKPLGAPDP